MGLVFRPIQGVSGSLARPKTANLIEPLLNAADKVRCYAKERAEIRWSHIPAMIQESG